ncbi:hypothetical protein ONZ45_g19592 [Pleurotus djamor]|nr:hypothetical protein ONZ45_g19592 [Pleurotus djamor]
MLSVQPAMSSATDTKASRPRPANLVPPSPRPLSTPGLSLLSPRLMTPSSSMRPTSEFIPSATLPARDVESLDQWFANFQNYEATLEEMAAASTDPKFHEELTTIEHWFKILSEPERTATLYTLLQHSSQVQIRFLIAVLQQMLKTDANPPPTASIEGQIIKGKARNARPPSLNIPEIGAQSPFPSAVESAALRSSEPSALEPKGQDLLVSAPANVSWDSMVKTPSTPMFSNAKSTKIDQPQYPGTQHPAMAMPGFPGNAFNLNMMGAMGLSAEAQVLAMQMMMNNLAQSGQMPQQPKTSRQPSGSQGQRSSNPRQTGSNNNWRARQREVS